MNNLKCSFKLRIGEEIEIQVNAAEIQVDSYDETTGQYTFEIFYPDLDYEHVQSRKICLMESETRPGFVKLFDVHDQSGTKTCTLLRERKVSLRRFVLHKGKSVTVQVPKSSNILSFEWVDRQIIMWASCDSWNEKSSLELHLLNEHDEIRYDFDLVGTVLNATNSGFDEVPRTKHVFKTLGTFELITNSFKF